VLIRLASENDLSAVAAVLRDCIADVRQAGIDQWDETDASRETLLADVRDAPMHVAFMDQEALVAALVLNDVQNDGWSNARWTIIGVPILAVHRLMVDPKYQGQGIARDLMQFAETWRATVDMARSGPTHSPAILELCVSITA
jgi:GNAT superfamily N-acetyltransferase